MSKFSLSVHSFTPPTLPDLLVEDFPPEVFRSPQIPGPLAAISPLCFTLELPSARDTDSLYPATHLQLTYSHEGTGEIFAADTITSLDLVKSNNGAEPNFYGVQVPADKIPRTKVNEGKTAAAEVMVYAWRRDKLLGKWTVGRIEGLGLEGLKSQPIHLRRVQQWETERAKRNGT